MCAPDCLIKALARHPICFLETIGDKQGATNGWEETPIRFYLEAHMCTLIIPFILIDIFNLNKANIDELTQISVMKETEEACLFYIVEWYPSDIGTSHYRKPIYKWVNKVGWM